MMQIMTMSSFAQEQDAQICVIGAGSVVNRDIPSNVIAVGNPCKAISKIAEKDKEKYPIWNDKT